MAFRKYWTPYSGKEDPNDCLESYKSAAKAEKWSASQMLEYVGLKLKKKAKHWFSNLTEKAKTNTHTSEGRAGTTDTSHKVSKYHWCYTGK